MNDATSGIIRSGGVVAGSIGLGLLTLSLSYDVAPRSTVVGAVPSAPARPRRPRPTVAERG